MSTPLETSREESPAQKWTGKVFEGIKAGSKMQTRFQILDNKKLSKETVAGIQDMNLGKIKNGRPSGKATIRFDCGKNTGSKPHINIDPKGYPSGKNPHIEVPETIIKGAEYMNKSLKYAGVVLTVASVAVEIWRIGSAIKDDIFVCENAKEIIQELDDAIKKLKETCLAETDLTIKQEIMDTILHLQKILRDVERTKKAPVKTIRTVSSAIGGWGGGVAAGSGGAWAGATTGATIGSLFGPVGATVGAPIGAVIGAIGLGIGGGIIGSKAGENLAEAGLTMLDK
ncbi:uncharacterized protein LOC117229413 [Megalopta genalis]|uniref:uncharacterized protein LOC117229413 n=1 Tax=Megalopta genalis TaxID=115081 RepID=UPI003FCF0F2B